MVLYISLLSTFIAGVLQKLIVGYWWVRLAGKSSTLDVSCLPVIVGYQVNYPAAVIARPQQVGYISIEDYSAESAITERT